MQLTDEEQEVINHFLKLAKDKTDGKRFRTFAELTEPADLLYDEKYGNDASKKLLIVYIRFLQSQNPEDSSIPLLEAVIPKDSINIWVTEEEYLKQFGETPVNSIEYDGAGYIIVKGGIRIDTHPKTFEKERLQFNANKIKSS